MQVTRAKRCEWIQKDRPLILEVIKKFPCLASTKWVNFMSVLLYVLFEIFQVQRKFKAILQLEREVNSLMNSWADWSAKILEVSKRESSSRPYLKKLKALEEAESCLYPDGK